MNRKVYIYTTYGNTLTPGSIEEITCSRLRNIFKGDTFTTSVTKAGIGSNLYPPSDTISDTDLVVYDTDYQNASLPDSTILAKVTSKIPATNIFIASTNNRDSKLTSLTDWKDYVKTFIEKSSNRIQDIIKFVPKPIVDFFVKNLDFELTNNVLIRK